MLHFTSNFRLTHYLMNGLKRHVSFAQATLLILLAALINLAVLFIWGQGVPSATNGPAQRGSNKYQFINTGPTSAFRLDKETGEVLLFLLDHKNDRLEVFSTTETQTPKAAPPVANTDGPFKPSDLVDYEALGIDPVTGLIADYDRFNRARIERGMEPVAKP